jgi:predicted enzyme related to lactoylglutathione lyase
MQTRNPLIIHYVRDMDRAWTFYHDVLGLAADTRSSGWSTLTCGGVIVALHILGADDTEGPLPHAGLNLEVDDLDAAVQEVEAAGGTVLQVREAGGGVPVRLAEVRDPEGNGFELRQFVGLRDA